MHQGIEGTVYRTTVPNHSTIPHNTQVQFFYQVSTFRHFIDRVFTACTLGQLTNEINKIRNTTSNNFFKESSINRRIMCMDKNKRRIVIELNSKLFTLEYFPG